MSYPYYPTPTAHGEDGEAALPEFKRATDPGGYLPDPGLADAVNVALLLGQPLLLTGKHRTGAASGAYAQTRRPA